MYYLDLSQKISFAECEFRKFITGERHITRKWDKSVLLLVFKNALYFEEDGKEVCVPESSWYIQRDNLLQRGNVGSPAPEYFYIHFDGKYLNDTEYTETTLPISGKFDMQTIYPLVKELYENQNDIKNGTLYGNIVFKYILLKIKREFETTQNGLAYQLNEYILNRFHMSVTIKDISGQFGYCEDYLGRVFKKQFGITIHQYITHLRIQKAKQLLLCSTKSIHEISEEVGYTSHSLFYKSFLKIENKSPQQWKDENRSFMSGSDMGNEH
ncbi:MAG: helix-turn-helix transcriptional regulator [Eubacteriales bacterium]|nr:helix-turn-helix transcriptional regulator [Eubacteriales bacterium]